MIERSGNNGASSRCERMFGQWMYADRPLIGSRAVAVVKRASELNEVEI